MFQLIGRELYRWDLDRKVKLSVYEAIDEVHVAKHGGDEALIVTPKKEKGMVVADIPNILLQTARKITVYAVKDGATIGSDTFLVKYKEKPSDYIYTPEDVKTWEDHEQRISDIEKNGSSGSLKPLTIQIGNEKLEYDGSGAVTITIPDGTLAKVEKDSTDTVLEMTGDFSKYYVFPEMEELTVTGEGDFFFQSGETPTTLNLEDAVKVPDSFTVESNKVYEINILNGCMTYQSWAVE